MIGCSEADVLDALASFKERKLMRRFAAVMNHRSAGYKANAMGVWAVPEDELDEIGPRMAGFARVSHCYRRPIYDDWPYSIFTMVHGMNARECEETIAAIRDETGVDEYALLWSVKEYKKTRVRYFTPSGTRGAPSTSPASEQLRPTAASHAEQPAPAPHRPRSQARARDGGGPRLARPSAIACSLVCAAPSPSARAGRWRSPTGARGTGTTPGGTSPMPLAHVRARTRSTSSPGSAGNAARGQQRARRGVVEPAVGRHVERAGVVVEHDERERVDEVVDVHRLHRRRRTPHAQRRSPEQQARRQPLRARTEHGCGPQGGDDDAGVVGPPLGEQALDLGGLHAPARTRGWDAAARPR